MLLLNVSFLIFGGLPERTMTFTIPLQSLKASPPISNTLLGMSTSVMEWHPLKAELSISFIELGMTMLLSETQFMNIFDGISLMPAGKLTILSPEQSWKMLLASDLTLLGMNMLSRLEHPLKASWSMLLMELVMFTSCRLEHPSKMLLAMLSMLVVNENDFYNPARDPKVLFSVFSDTMKDLGFHPIKLILSVLMECGCRVTAGIYAKKDRGDLSAWDPVSSTKKV